MDRKRWIEVAASWFPLAVLAAVAALVLMPSLPGWLLPVMLFTAFALFVASPFALLVRIALRTSGDPLWRANVGLPLRGRWLAYLAAFLFCLPLLLCLFWAGRILLVFAGVLPDPH